MNLNLIGHRITRNEMQNNMTPNQKMNIQVTVGHQIRLPKQFGPDSVGTIVVKVMVGNPMQPLYMYMEQVNNFKNVDADMTLDEEEAMSLFKTICLPLAIEKTEESLNGMCKLYHIPELKLNKNPAK